jgi:hypothetical protein
MDKQFSDLHAIQALTALNWWTCYANTTGKNIAWIPTIQALFYSQNKNVAGGTAVKNRMLDPQYYNELMKIIPYGLADGTLSSSFPDPYELLVFLMRSVGIEEAIIQNQLLSEGVTDPAKYMLNSVVKQQGKAFSDQVIEVAKSQGIEAAQSMIDQYKSTGTVPSPTTSTPKYVAPTSVPKRGSLPSFTTARAATTRPGLRGLGNPNQSQGMSKGAVILTSLAILTVMKAINS